MADKVDSHTDIPSRSMRASHADRHTTVQLLQDAMARGLLDPDEASERMAAAFAAKHLRDLDALSADLPRDSASDDGTPGWRALAAMAVAQFQNSMTDATGRLRPARVAAILLALFLILIVGAVTAQFFADMWGATPPRGFHHR